MALCDILLVPRGSYKGILQNVTAERWSWFIF